MNAEQAQQLIAFGMCLANKKLLDGAKPETFTDDAIAAAVRELQSRATNGTPEPERSAVAELLVKLGCEPKRFPTLAEAVFGAVKEYAEFMGWKKTMRAMAGPGLTGRESTPAGRRAYVDDCKAKTGSLP